MKCQRHVNINSLHYSYVILISIPVFFVCFPAPALPVTPQVSAPAGRTPTIPGCPCLSECGAAPSGCCRDLKRCRGAPPASGHPAGLFPTVAPVGAPLFPVAPSPR